MSKQSRAKSRVRRENLAKRKSKGTGTAATMYISNLNRMSDANHYFAKEALLDELHAILCDRRVFKDNKFMNMFRDNFWNSLEREIDMHHSSSPKRVKALELIARIRMF